MLSLFLYTSSTLSQAIQTLPVTSLWGAANVEFFVAQAAMSYILYRTVTNKNYFRQLLDLAVFIVLAGVYLTLVQTELFACFMFLAEFTIVIFFYSLYLHLQISTKRDESSVPGGYAVAAISAALALLSTTLRPGTEEAYSAFTDFYVRSNYSALNDLGFFFYTVFRSNYSLHAIVGLILLFLTLFLFITVNVYYFLNLSRKDAFQKSSSKLSSARGYYENTAEEVQKVITNNPGPDDKQ